jgi:uncharacterized LabA/DUF88 family protein
MADKTTYENVYVYIDGFNLYYRSLKNASYPAKWLNLKKMTTQLFPDLKLEIKKIKYFTADVSGKVSRTAPKDQANYLKALKTLKEIEIIKGRFSVHINNAHLSNPIEFYPKHFKLKCTEHNNCNDKPSSVKILKYEEKGSDVNLGCHLVKDAFTDKFDLAIVITADTDLLEPIKMVIENEKDIKLVSPKEPSTKSKKAAKQIHTSFLSLLGRDNIVETNQRIIETSQFDNEILCSNGSIIIKPLEW